MAQITNAQRHQIAYLGAVLLEAPGYRDSVMRLSPTMFEPGILEDVFSAVYRLVFAGKGVDPITVADQAAAAAQNAEEIRRTIFRWAETCPSVSHLEDYESLQYFQTQLGDSGILDELVAQGVEEEDTIHIGEYEFDYLY